MKTSKAGKVLSYVPIVMAVTILAVMAMSVFHVRSQMVILGQPSFANQTLATNLQLAPSTNECTLLLTNATEIGSITVLAVDTNEVVHFFDNPSGTNIWTNAAYTNYSTFSSNIVVTSTNAQGIITTNTYTGVTYSLVVTNAASTNTQVPVITVSVPVGAQSTLYGRWDFGRGVTIQTKGTNATIVFTYRRLF